jgi:multimeric flavodoxin WrbA
MKEFPTPKEALLSLFRNMTRMFDGEAYHHVDTLYQFVFTDIENGFPVHIRFSKGTAAYGEGWAEQPPVVIRTTSDVWLDIAGRFRSPVWALLTKKVRIEGNIALLRLLPRLLTRTIKTPKAQQAVRAGNQPFKTLVFIGNPRKKNGLTSFFLSPFIEGMKKAGADVEEVYLYEKKINPCLGCFACWTRTPGACVQKDDQKELLEKMERSDLIVYAVPLYYHGLPGLVKDHFDRQLPRVHPYVVKLNGLMSHPRRTEAQQNFVLFSICGFPEIEQFEPLVRTFEAYTRHDNTKLCAKVLIPSAMQLYHNPTRRSVLLKKFELLRSAGEQVVRQGSIPKRILKQIAKVHHPGDWITGANLYWHHEIESNSGSAGTGEHC